MFDYNVFKGFYNDDAVARVEEMHAKQRATGKWHISATTNNTKCGTDILCINFPAGVTCRENAPCLKFCYALKGRQKMANVWQAYARNYIIWSENPMQYWNELEAMIQFNGVHMVRLFDCGDIPSIDWLVQLVAFAAKHPEVTFSGFTKKYQMLTLVNLPENVIFRCSKTGCAEWDSDIPTGLPIADIKFDADQKMEGFHCGCKKTCSECKVCYTTKSDVWFDLH